MLYFWGWPLGERVGSCSKANSPFPTPLNISEQEPLHSSFRQRKGATYRNSRVRFDSHLEIGGVVVLSVLLIVLSDSNLQFQSSIPFTDLLWCQFSGSWQLMSWVQSGHHVVSFFHLLGFQYPWNSTRDMAQSIIYCSWGGSKGPWLCLMSKLLLEINIF